MTLENDANTPAPAEAAAAVEVGTSALQTAPADPAQPNDISAPVETQPQPSMVAPLVGRPPLKRPSRLADDWLKKRATNKKPLIVTIRHDTRDLSGTSMVGTFQVRHYNDNVEMITLELEESWQPLVNSTREAIVHRSAKGRCVLLDARYTRVKEDGRYGVNFNGKRESQEHKTGYQTMRGIVREFTDPDGTKRYLFQDIVTGKFALPRHADRERLEQFAPQWVGREVDLWYFPAINYRIVSLIDWDNPDCGTGTVHLPDEFTENRMAAMAEGLVAIRLSKTWFDGQRRRSSDTGTSGHWYEEEVRINPALFLAINPNDLPGLQALDEEAFKVAIRRKKGFALKAVEKGQHNLQGGVDPHDVRVAYNDAEELLSSFYQQGRLADLMVEQASYDLTPANSTDQPKTAGVYASRICSNPMCERINCFSPDLDKFDLLGLLCTKCKKTPLFIDLVDVLAWQQEQQEQQAETAKSLMLLPTPAPEGPPAIIPAEPPPLQPVVINIQREQDDDKRQQFKAKDKAAKQEFRKGQNSPTAPAEVATDMVATDDPASTDSTTQPTKATTTTTKTPARKSKATKVEPVEVDMTDWKYTDYVSALKTCGQENTGDLATLKKRLETHLEATPADTHRLAAKPETPPSPTKKARKAVKAVARRKTEAPKAPGTVLAQLASYKEKLAARKGDPDAEAKAEDEKEEAKAKKEATRQKAAAKLAAAAAALPAPEGPPAIIPAELRPKKTVKVEQTKAAKKGKAKAGKAPKADAATGAKAKPTAKPAAPKKGRK